MFSRQAVVFPLLYLKGEMHSAHIGSLECANREIIKSKQCRPWFRFVIRFYS